MLPLLLNGATLKSLSSKSASALQEASLQLAQALHEVILDEVFDVSVEVFGEVQASEILRAAA